ncbi:MAG TPA: hypothetical protein PLN21_09250 [Gemmatales bacterium]|nr:hypothetical protein [Gemmatales bacterium]
MTKLHWILLIAAAAFAGFGSAWIIKPVAEPVIEVQYLKAFPFVEVQVNGKKVDLTKIQIPLDNKKKGGDLPFAAFVMNVDCPCNPCDCTTCSCHLAVGQRSKPEPKPEFLGIGDLVSILKEFKEAIFGSANKPGLRDDIKNGLSDWTATLKVAFVGVVAVHFGLFGWIAVSLHQVANKP